MKISKFQSWKCPDCGLRFSTPLPEMDIRTCPACTGVLQAAGAPFASQRIGRRRTEHTCPRVEVLLDNVRSAWNVGSIFRTAEGAGVSRIYLCGITPSPENKKVVKTALGAQKWVPWSCHPDSLELVHRLRQGGRRIWSLEGGARSRPIEAARLQMDDAVHVWVFGNEISGVDPQVLAASDACWHIPLAGAKESLNIAVACGIALFLQPGAA
jgi:tRNA G18 (ribose-2'-O)-methylase SpoU